jgi:hypothetical protein
VSAAGEREPPRYVWYTLDEALELLAVLEDSRDAIIDASRLAAVMPTEVQAADSAVDSIPMGRDEATMRTEPLRASEAARRLDIATKELLRLFHEHKIRYVTVDGIAHVPPDAIDEYRSTTVLS